jgi:sRNA-binding regulator protein Hfq
VQASAVPRPEAPAAPVVPKPPPAAPPPQDGGDDEDGATMIAKVPDELLKRAGSEEAEQEAHYREVFEQFLATKKQCNEAVAGLTYDKFVVTLRKNREQIVQKHGAAKVRFTVYVKEGKAALKATPIKE